MSIIMTSVHSPLLHVNEMLHSMKYTFIFMTYHEYHNLLILHEQKVFLEIVHENESAIQVPHTVFNHAEIHFG